MKKIALATMVSLSLLGSVTHAETKKPAKAQSAKPEPEVKPDFAPIQQKSKMLAIQLETCTIRVRTIFVRIRAKLPLEGPMPQECADDGKAQLKAAYDEAKAVYGKQTPPPELVEWRLEWSSAFDASVPLDSDIERVFLQRIAEAKQKAERATTKLEIAME